MNGPFSAFRLTSSPTKTNNQTPKSKVAMGLPLGARATQPPTEKVAILGASVWTAPYNPQPCPTCVWKKCRVGVVLGFMSGGLRSCLKGAPRSFMPGISGSLAYLGGPRFLASTELLLTIVLLTYLIKVTAMCMAQLMFASAWMLRRLSNWSKIGAFLGLIWGLYWDTKWVY